MQSENKVIEEKILTPEKVKNEPVSPPRDTSSRFDSVYDVPTNLKVTSNKNRLDTPIERNGKIYYPLIFPCENCGIRFSCESTLRAHVALYCTHRLNSSDGEVRMLRRTISTRRRNKRRQSEIQYSPEKIIFLNETKETILQRIQKSLNNVIPDRCYKTDNILYVAFRLNDDPTGTDECCSPLDLSMKENDGEIGPLDLSTNDLKCSICGYKGNTQRGMKLHLKLHEGKANDKLTCDFCQSVFFSKGRYTRHINSHEDGLRSCIKREQQLSCFVCHYCGIEFSSPHVLNQHLTSYCKKRLQPEAFCTTCGIGFRNKGSYTAHKLYYCPSKETNHVTS